MDIDAMIDDALGNRPDTERHWLNGLFEMWAAFRDDIPEAVRITDADLEREQKHLDSVLYGPKYRTYGGSGKPLCTSTSEEMAEIDLQAVHHRRALWAAICAVLDAPDASAQEEALAAFVDLWHVDNDRPQPSPHCHVDSGPQLGRFITPPWLDNKAMEGHPAWREYLETVWYPHFAPDWSRERWEKERR